jgi:predicted nucleic acid-binding Zn ribbon protein
VGGEGRRPEPRALGELMTELLKKVAGPKRRELEDLNEAWARAAGPEVARRSWPLGLGRGGRLTVSFSSAALRQEVQAFRKEEILARLREAFPARRIAALKCVLGG